MTQLTWEAIDPIDTSKYLDAIQKAQAQSVVGVEQIGAAYKGYQDNLKKQNTNDMLTALNQAQNPEQLAAAQANIAAMQQRWGSGYDMDAVRTAMDERPAVLMERDSKALQYQQAKAQNDAMPMVNKAIAGIVNSREGMTPEQQAMVNNLAQAGYDTTGIMNTIGNTIVDDFNTNRTYTTGRSDRAEDRKTAADQFEKTFNQNAYQFGQTNDRANRESAWNMGKDAYGADQASGAGTTYVAADGTEYTTGGGGGAAIANYASKFVPSSGVRGIRNNNPGNIEFYNQPGASIESKGGRFARFSTPEQGINAMSKQLDLYYTGKSRNVTKPINTIQDIITTWAPPKNNKGQVENKTAVYIANVAESMGVSPTAKLNLNDPNIKAALMSAMITQENGGNPYTREQYIAGITGNTAGNTPTTAPLVGIDRKVQQKIRGEYQDAMLKYNENLALKDQPVNVGNVLAGLTAKEKGSIWTQDSFDIVNALKDNPQLAGLSAEGITNVYNRAKAWQSKPGVPLVGYNSSAGLKKSIDNIIKDEIGIDTKRKEHIAKASHPSNKYAQQIQQEFEAKGVSLSAKEALLHIDPARYQSLYGKPTVKVQEAVDKKVDKAAATTPPPASKGKGTPAATKTTPTKTSVPTSTTPAQVKNPPPKLTKQDIVNFYVKRGKVDNVMPGNLFGTPDIKEREKNRELLGQAQKEATERLKAIEVKEEADKEAKKASQREASEKIRKAAAEREKQRIAKERLKLIEEQKAKAKQKSDQQKKLEATFTNASKAGNEEARKRFYTK